MLDGSGAVSVIISSSIVCKMWLTSIIDPIFFDGVIENVSSEYTPFGKLSVLNNCLEDFDTGVEVSIEVWVGNIGTVIIILIFTFFWFWGQDEVASQFDWQFPINTWF